jgi:hypothetical protein
MRELPLTTYAVDEVQKRYSFFYLIGCFASALSGILAYGFSQMAPLQSLSGWQWIFIMQGVVSRSCSKGPEVQ